MYLDGTVLEFTIVQNTQLIVYFAIRALLWDNDFINDFPPAGEAGGK